MTITIIVLVASLIGEIQHQERMTHAFKSDCLISLADRHRFHLNFEQARHGWDIATNTKIHYRSEILSWNRPSAYAAWDRETDMRCRSWYLLMGIMNPTAPNISGQMFTARILPSYERWPEKVKYLYELRDLIGQEAFDRGEMPSPSANYRVRPD
jgi:hypothetical protein